MPQNVSRVRALGMGSAYLAAMDDLPAASYNPASFALYRDSKNFRLTFFLAPAMPAVVAVENDAFWGKPVSTGQQIGMSALSLLKGVAVTFGRVDMGFVFLEPALLDSTFLRQEAFHANSLFDNQYNTLVLRLRLAEQISIGASLHLSSYRDRVGDQRTDLGATYGVLMRPKPFLRFGVSLYSAPKMAPDYRMLLDEFYTEGVNIGLSTDLPFSTTLNFDVRNVAVGQDSLTEIFLFGLEKRFWGQLALRGGLQYHTMGDDFVYAAGMSLLDLNILFARENRLAHNQFALNYAIMRRKLAAEPQFIHAVQLTIRL